jgi:hypothetical protein
MYDGTKIITGLVIFLAFMTFPIWYNAAMGKASYRPELQKPPLGTSCVESKEYMQSMHMNLLNSWRDWFVRQDDKTYISRVGGQERQFKMSLTNTCLKQCHTNKAEFCDKCHNYVGVAPYCFDCHLIPKGK